MRISQLLPLALAAFTTAARAPSNSVLLSNVQTLTFRAGRKTAARRVSAIPQLTCVGGNAKGLYEVDVLRCKNAGSDYDDANVQWTCQASLPPEFKLGSTDVTCEGYSSPDDPYVLKDSCGVEYRLVLTEAGEAKYGRRGEGGFRGRRLWDEIFPIIFWALFIGVIALIVRSIWTGNGNNRQPPNFRGGCGGGGFDDGSDDPPPPYTPRAPPKPSYGTTGQQGWRPGFWTGAATGAAAGYYAGNRTRTDPQRWRKIVKPKPLKLSI